MRSSEDDCEDAVIKNGLELNKEIKEVENCANYQHPHFNIRPMFQNFMHLPRYCSSNMSDIDPKQFQIAADTRNQFRPPMYTSHTTPNMPLSTHNLPHTVHNMTHTVHNMPLTTHSMRLPNGPYMSHQGNEFMQCPPPPPPPNFIPNMNLANSSMQTTVCFRPPYNDGRMPNPLFSMPLVIGNSYYNAPPFVKTPESDSDNNSSASDDFQKEGRTCPSNEPPLYVNENHVYDTYVVPHQHQEWQNFHPPISSKNIYKRFPRPQNFFHFTGDAPNANINNHQKHFSKAYSRTPCCCTCGKQGHEAHECAEQNDLKQRKLNKLL